MDRKKTIKYIGGGVAGFDRKWGGTQATNYALLTAMADHPDFEIQARFRREFVNAAAVAAFLEGADLTHVDDTTVVTWMYEAGMPPPDVIGPITRSPLKDYQGWRAAYTPEWFYRVQVIRLNYAEEPQHPSLVTLIRHGVDTEMLRPGPPRPRKYVLWAGNQKRYAKNWPLMQEIMRITKLPPPYEFKVMSGYAVQDYWRILDETALVVNTSRYESFCSAAFEAMAKGVPVIWRENLQGGVHESAGLRVCYDAADYRTGISVALKEKNYLVLGQFARRYCEDRVSLAVMREDLTRIYRLALATRGQQ